jgi:cytochrome c
MKLTRHLAAAAAATFAFAAPALAEGDPAAGEKTFARCKACHMIESPSETIVRGGRVGPNLYGVIGRQAGAAEGYDQYGDSLVQAGEDGLVWDQDNLAAYVKDPQGYLSEYLGERARSRMSYKLRRGGEDVAAYLAQFSE